MFSISKSIALTAVALAVVTTGTASAKTLILRSTGPSAKIYPAGTSIPDGTKITLKSGDMVTILDSRGTRVLKTPGTFSTTATLTSTNSAVSAMLKNTNTKQGRTGATRGDFIPQPPSIWLVNSQRPGKMCVDNPLAVSVWRPSSETTETLKITRVSDGKTAVVSFKPRISETPWPMAELPVTVGTEFKISGARADKPIVIRIETLGVNAQDPSIALPALDRQGCVAQFDQFVETLAVPKDEPTPVS